MKLLFVSSTTEGGSGRSQRELAARLVGMGHEVVFLVDDGAPARQARWWYGQLSDLAAHLEGRPGHRVADWLEHRLGRRPRRTVIAGTEHLTTPIPQNAVEGVIDGFSPDVVVGNSLERLAWRRIHRVCRRKGIPTVLYVREVTSLAHFVHGEVPELIVANAESLADAVRAQGFECSFVPSVTEVDVTLTESTRRVALAINPMSNRGGDVVWRLAGVLPEIRFVVQESLMLSEEELATVQHHVEHLPNVEFRRAEPPGPRLYRDARVLLVPHRVDNRPRVIAEAQANGIPVIAADMPALAEAVGEGGCCLDTEDVEGWMAVLRMLWNDEDRYQQMASAALAQSRRPDIDPAKVATSFEVLVRGLLDRHPG